MTEHAAGLEQEALREYYRGGERLSEETALTALPAEALRARLARSVEYYEDNYRPLLPAERDGAVLDIGCGQGAFLEFMRRAGFTRLEGTEIGQAALSCCRRLGFSGVVESEDPAAFLRERPGRYALIHIGHFIEHIPKAAMFPFLHALREALAPGGRLLVVTPNMSSLGGVVHRYKTFGHELGFTEWSLEQLLRRAGFQDVLVCGDRQAVRGRPKRWLWLVARRLVRGLLRGLYLIEIGADRPRILTTNLIAAAFR